MRRVVWVRLLIDDHHVRAEVEGTADRLPVVQPVPLRVANSLIASGTPSVIMRQAAYGPAERPS